LRDEFAVTLRAEGPADGSKLLFKINCRRSTSSLDSSPEGKIPFGATRAHFSDSL
jgi:hypothetical protein